jgi:SAM-dependent methyltransferase
VDPKQIVRAGYDRVSPAYRTERRGAYEHDYTAWVDRLCSGLGPNPHVLDLGCGCGIPASRLLASRGRVTGVDISPVQVDRARTLVPGGCFICEDLCRVGFPAASFDAVISFYAIIHVPIEEQASLFGRIARWLKPRGLFMSTLGSTPWTGTESDWLGIEGVTMYWSHADAETYRRWLHESGFELLVDEFVPEGDAGHQLFLATRIG